MSTFFLYTFFVGFGLTVVSALLGAVDASGAHLGGHGHGGLGHGHGDAGLGHGHGGPGHGGLDQGGAHAGPADNQNVFGNTSSVSPVNFQSLVAFMMGFGGVGYLFTRFSLATAVLALPAAVLGGWVTGWMLYRWLRFLTRGERPMPPTMYVGILGKLTAGIRENGTGELVYTQNDTRKVMAARSSDPGRTIPAGEEVVVLRYENGFAYVQPWSEVKDRQML